MKFPKKLQIPHFRGVFMQNKISEEVAINKECEIDNLDDKKNSGTQWVVYIW